MGRPKKIVIEPATDSQNAVAEVLAKWCGIPGCMIANHLEEVRELEQALENVGYYIVKKRVD